MAATAIGIDIGGTGTRAARVAPNGTVEDVRRVATRRAAEDALADCVALARALMAPGVAGLGVGVPGQVDAATRAVFSGGYVDLSGIDFARRLEDATGLAVAVENDGGAALLGERAHGAARGCGSAVLLAIGTGIGGAAVERGRLVRGRRSAGQLGHVVVEPGGRPCLCGKRGCVETTSSGTALGRLMAEAGLAAGTRAADLLASDDPAARAVLDAWARPLRAAVDSLVAALDPEVVVMGGGLGAEAAAALARIPEAPGWFGAPVVPAMLGPDAGVIGAAVAAMGEGKRAVLVNGVPASGKSTLARALGDAMGWPVLALDTVKQPFLDALPGPHEGGDRAFNRVLGRASMAAMWGVVGDAPAGSGFVLDAWWGLEPPDVVAAGLSRAGVGAVAELWCEAPPAVVGARYAARVASRGPGHPGADYVPELVALAARAAPLALGPVLRVDTTGAPDVGAVAAWAAQAIARGA